MSISIRYARISGRNSCMLNWFRKRREGELERLREENARLRAENAQLREENAKLAARVAELEACVSELRARLEQNLKEFIEASFQRSAVNSGFAEETWFRQKAGRPARASRTSAGTRSHWGSRQGHSRQTQGLPQLSCAACRS